MKQVHSNHTGIEKTRQLVNKSVYWVNMNAYIENAIKQYSTCLGFHNTQLQERTTPYKVLTKQWEVVSTDICMINNENLLCIVDYYNEFPVMKKVEILSAEDLIQLVKIVFAELGLPKKLVSNADTNFVSE